MVTALTKNIPFILDRNLATANCTGNHVCTSCIELSLPLLYIDVVSPCICSKKRESLSDLAPLLWHSFGTVTALLQEIINIYPSVNPAVLTAGQSNRVCNALALLQVRSVACILFFSSLS